MGDKGSKDKSKREHQKAAQHTTKEKRQIKHDQKKKVVPDPAAPTGR